MTPQAAADWAINNGIGFVHRELLEKFAGYIMNLHCVTVGSGSASVMPGTLPACKTRSDGQKISAMPEAARPPQPHPGKRYC